MIEGKTVACIGGTFNRLHAGHRLLVTTAFQAADRVFIGVSSDALVRRLRGLAAAAVRPYAQREADVRRLLAPFGPERYELTPLDDPFIPAKRPEFDAIVVSPDTLERAEEINALRDLNGLQPMKVVQIPFVEAFDGRPISATRIVAGEIDEDGKAVVKVAPSAKPAAPVKAPPPRAPKLEAPVMAPAPAMEQKAPAPKASPKPAAKPAAKRSAKRRPKAKPKAKAKAKKKKAASGKKAAAKRGAVRSKARKGSRAGGPRRRR